MSYQYGGGCFQQPGTGRCNQYAGPDKDGCVLGAKGRCKAGKGFIRAMGPQRQRTAKQLLNDARLGAMARERAAAKKAAKMNGGYGEYQYGGGCYQQPGTGRCNQYAGPDKDGCVLGAKGRCKAGKGFIRAMGPKRQRTAKQLLNDARWRTIRLLIRFIETRFQ
jgi:hypothetical protein